MHSADSSAGKDGLSFFPHVGKPQGADDQLAPTEVTTLPKVCINQHPIHIGSRGWYIPRLCYTSDSDACLLAASCLATPVPSNCNGFRTRLRSKRGRYAPSTDNLTPQRAALSPFHGEGEGEGGGSIDSNHSNHSIPPLSSDFPQRRRKQASATPARRSIACCRHASDSFRTSMHRGALQLAPRGGPLPLRRPQGPKAPWMAQWKSSAVV